MQKNYRRQFLKGLAAATASSALPRGVYASHHDEDFDTWFERYRSGTLYSPQNHCLKQTPLEVIEGSLPRDLIGDFYRNGPNPQFRSQGKYHWFDGDGMIHHLRLRGKTTPYYQNRFVQTKKYLYERSKGESLRMGLNESFGVLGKLDFLAGQLETLNTSNTDLVAFNEKLLSLWYMGDQPYELNLNTLATERQSSVNMVAHPKICSQTGELIYFDLNLSPVELPVVDMGDRQRLIHGSISKEGFVQKKLPITLPSARLIHDIGITCEDRPDLRFSVVFDTPASFPFRSLMSNNSRIGIIPRYAESESEIRWVDIDPCYVLHIPNCFIQDGLLHIVATRISDLAHLRKNLPSIGDHTFESYLWEWVIDLSNNSVIESRQLTSQMIEFPTINSKFTGVPQRFFYCPMLSSSCDVKFAGLVKYDLKNRSSQILQLPRQTYLEEVHFAAKADAIDEDDGYVMSFVRNLGKNKVSRHGSEFWVFDAKDISVPVVRLSVPHRVPLGFHATWVPLKN